MDFTEQDIAKYVAIAITGTLQDRFGIHSTAKMIKQLKEASQIDITKNASIEKSVKTYDNLVNG